jgi:hypothetical protein
MTTERDVGGIRVVHATPGRVRLKVAQVRRNPALASEIQTRLATVHGISQVEVNPLTGSVLLLYEVQGNASPDSLRALAEPLAALFPGFDLNNFAAERSSSTDGAHSAPSLASGITSFFGTLNSEVQQVTGGNADLKILLPLTLFLLGVRGVLVAEQLALPTWYDFLWFSLGTFIMLNPRLGEGRQ